MAYLRNGVREYLVWRTEDRALDWFVLRGNEYASLLSDARGIIQSEVFPGLWLDVPALLRDDGPIILRALDEGLASPEHAAFVARLERAGGGGK